MITVCATYLLGAVETRKADGTVAVVPSLPVAILDADTTVQANVRILLAGIELGTVLTTHAFITPASNKDEKYRSNRLDRGP